MSKLSEDEGALDTRRRNLKDTDLNKAHTVIKKPIGHISLVAVVTVCDTFAHDKLAVGWRNGAVVTIQFKVLKHRLD